MDYLDQHEKAQLQGLIDEQKRIIAKARAEQARLKDLMGELLKRTTTKG